MCKKIIISQTLFTKEKRWITLSLSLSKCALIAFAAAFVACSSDCKSNEDKQSGCVERTYYDKDRKQLRSEIWWKNYQKNGEYKEFYSDGSPREESLYKDGKRDGHYKAYNRGGMLSVEATYKGGSLDGFYKDYYNQSGAPHIETAYKKGKIDGIYKKYFNNGQPQIETSYKDDRKDGIYKEFNKNGDLIKDCEYKEGKVVSSTVGKCF